LTLKRCRSPVDCEPSKNTRGLVGGIAFFRNAQFCESTLYYISNLYAATLMTHLRLKRIELSMATTDQDFGRRKNQPDRDYRGPQI